jgi:hypothetical protein
MLCKHKKMEKLAKAKKLGLVLSHYQPLTWVWRVMAWICTPFVFSMTILKAINYPTQPKTPIWPPQICYIIPRSRGAQLLNTQPNPLLHSSIILNFPTHHPSLLLLGNQAFRLLKNTTKIRLFLHLTMVVAKSNALCFN